MPKLGDLRQIFFPLWTSVNLIYILIIIIVPICVLVVRVKWAKTDRAFSTVPGTYWVLNNWKFLLFMSLSSVGISALRVNGVALHIGEASDHIKWSGLLLPRKLRSYISGHTLRLNLHSQQQSGSWPLWIRGRQLERAKEGLPEDYNGQGKAEITILKDNLCSNYHLKVHGK